MMQTVVRTLEELKHYANQVVDALRGISWRDTRAVVLGLSGDLGVGKTAFVQCLAQVLGVSDSVISPTFVLRNDYDTTDSDFSSLIHIDAYRLERSEEVETVGWDSVLSKPQTLVAVEWVERVGDRAPHDATSVTISIRDGERVFTTDIL